MFNPFEKELSALEAEHLLILKNVHEGWHIDYKQDLINVKKQAKALSAFANTYGGWLIFGVEEAGDKEPVAGAFPGIESGQVQTLLEQLRQAADQHLAPSPYFETKVITGPSDALQLKQGRCILIVHIPRSMRSPHIHSDGRIYRRVADGSEPKAETDRFIIDQLSGRAEKIEKQTEDWLFRDLELAKGESDTPFLQLFLCLDPWAENHARLTTSLKEVRSILTDVEKDVSSVSFDAVHRISNGFMARQTKGRDPFRVGLNMRLLSSFDCEVMIPLNLYKHIEPQHLLIDIDDYQFGERFIDLLKARSHERVRVIDLNIAMNALTAIVVKYRRLLNLSQAGNDFFIKARIHNAWRTLPFIDVEQVMSDFEEFGVPMLMRQKTFVPPGTDPASFAKIAHVPPSESETASKEIQDIVSCMTQAYFVFAHIATAFGVTMYFEGETPEENDVIDPSDFRDAGTRAMAVQAKRAKRN